MTWRHGPWLSLLPSGLLTSGLLASGLLSQGKLPWTSGLDAALVEAAKKNTIVVVAINLPGERGSDSVMREHYTNPRLVELASHTVNVLLLVGPDGKPSADEPEVRRRYLQVTGDADVAAPHHMFVRPKGEGELLSAVAYRTTVAELEWAWVDALRQVRPEFAWKLDDGAHAPRRLLYGQARGGAVEVPPSKAEVASALRELKASRGGMRGAEALDSLAVLVRSEDQAAIDFIRAGLRSYPPAIRTQVLRAIADASPPVWHTVVVDYVDEKDNDLRAAAIDCLGALGSPKALSALQQQWRVEKEPALRLSLVRALAACGPADKATASLLKSVVEDRKQPSALRRLAVIVSVTLADKKVVERIAQLAFDDDDVAVRAAAAFLVASRRDVSLRPLLRSMLASEKDDAQRALLEAADKAMEGGPLTAFAAIERELETPTATPPAPRNRR